MAGSLWKALAEDNRRRILLLLREHEMYPTEIAKHFDTTLAAVSTNLRILKDADLIKETREGQKKRYSINPKTSMEIKDFFDRMWGHSLEDLKEFVEEKSNEGKGKGKEMNDKDYDIIRKEIVINASVDKVYSALIDPEQLTQWFPNIATLEPWTGGKIFFRFSKEVTKERKDHDVIGTIISIIPNKESILYLELYNKT